MQPRRGLFSMTKILAYLERRQGAFSSFLLAMALVGCRWLTGTASAQYAVRTPTPEERAQQYEDLAAEVAHLEKQGMVLRKVVQYVKPTVVHIDAERNDSFNTRGRRATSSIEDAGSGTI